MFRPNVGRRGRVGPNAGRNGQGIALLLMLMQQIQQLERKPPVTLGLMALMYGLHFQKEQSPELFSPYSLCPDRVLSHWDLTRIVASGLIHVDDWHLYHNMVSFLWKGCNLEYKMGSVRFLLTVVYLLVLCHVLVVVVALVLATGFQMPVLLNHNSPAFSSVYGFQVPTKYAAWLELVVIHFLVPRSSFIGHMCGILAGYLFVYSSVMQSVMTSGAGAFSRWLRAVAGPTYYRHDTPPPRYSRPPTSSFETDEDIARRLQEEEYQDHAAPQPQPGQPTPEHISPSELRRRRLARFGTGH
ncbi:serine protease family S54, putative [Phytophthora infestans T30-4]|uniref:Serine protease family S54, putative n=1 Tax=Phytophthora infestans (strain T30-4) TaxID=403677 RepID=D0MQN0_PHYIT|nr:serine protease family S54, putative [Phytophthora infestans T30-4]EEY57799.1 serine protease family S54, putative [Phytophthora infestans T30-4]|eukprot:XP_002908985.1 serine protease family S54, putative [Phytophthora infestans T30-4]